MLVYVLYGFFILACIVLVISILLQPGKSDAGALFSSSVSSTAFGPRGTASLLAKVTIGAAALFMLIALILALPALTGQHSVLQTAPADATPTPEPSPAATAAPQPTAAPSVAASPATSGAANTNANSTKPGATADIETSSATRSNAKASPTVKKK